MARTRLFALLFLVALVGGQVLPTKFVRAQDDDGSGDDGGADYGADYGDAAAGDGDVFDGSDGLLVGSGGGACPPHITPAKPTCGWSSDGSLESCTKNDPDWISVGIFFCSDVDPANCGCGPGGCTNEDGFALHQIMLNGEDDTCDTRGGWRETDLHFCNTGEFGGEVGSIHYEIHPDDVWKTPQQEVVKINLHQGDYCIGAVAGATFTAWDDSTMAPGQYSLQDYGTLQKYNIKSFRPYVDTGAQPEPGIGIKIVAWPNGNMGWPYDEITCDNNEWVNNVDTGCASAIHQTYCVPPDDGAGINGYFGDGISDGIDFGGNPDPPKEWIQSQGGVPFGSIMFGFYEGKDNKQCDYNWFDFCTGGSPENYCLAARFFNQDVDYPQDWESSKDFMIAETWINMGYLCENYGQNAFCLNTYDASQEGDECLNNELYDAAGSPINEWPIFVDQAWVQIRTNMGECN